MLALTPVGISHHLLPQSWCWLQREEPRDEPFTSYGKSGFPIALCRFGGISHKALLELGRLLGKRRGLSLALEHHGISHSERVAGEVPVPLL